MDPMSHFGHTRSRLGTGHAFVAPDSHVFVPRVGWPGCLCATVVSPEVGARFAMHIIDMAIGAESARAEPDVSRFVFVVSGAVACSTPHGGVSLGAGGFAYLPPDMEHRLLAEQPSRIVTFEKPFVPSVSGRVPEFTYGHLDSVALESGKTPGTAVRRLLGDAETFDMAVNVLSFEPGASLSMVEVHVMEHGLLMLRGGGVYRLADDWYPIARDDVLWMRSYCPQWFGALGAEPSAYLLYKDVNRDPLNARERARNVSESR